MWIRDLIQLFGEPDYPSTLYVQSSLLLRVDGFTVSHSLPQEMFLHSPLMIRLSQLHILQGQKNLLARSSMFAPRFFRLNRWSGLPRLNSLLPVMIVNLSFSRGPIKDGISSE